MPKKAMEKTIRIAATGAALPRRAWSNADLIAARKLESTPEWIESRTGIRQRYLVSEGESTATLARDAARQAMERAGVSAANIGAIVVATCTPDLTFPATAALVHGELGLPPTCAALDINAACSGFIYALATARGLMLGGQATTTLVVGAETFSSVLDWTDRSTCVLFGDGAGAVVLTSEATEPNAPPSGLLDIELGADGSAAMLLHSGTGVVRGQKAGVVHMEGKEIYRRAVRQMGQPPAMLAKHGLTATQLDWLIPHQANLRIIEAAAAEMGIPMEKVLLTVAEHANTSGASIPLALNAGIESGQLRPNQTILLEAFGAGLTWASALLKL